MRRLLAIVCGSTSRIRFALLASFSCCVLLAAPSRAASFSEFVDPNPAPGNAFGSTVVTLSTGNVVITSPFDDAGGTDAGAVYLFNGSTGALISTLRGAANEQLGADGVTALSNGNYVIGNWRWSGNRGAVIWGSGTTGVSGVISAANGLVGSTASDQIGNSGTGRSTVTALANGNYLVRSPFWNNGAVVDAGAVTWGSGTTGVVGAVSSANSLVGSTTNDMVGSANLVELASGNYVVCSQSWDNGAAADAGAVTWGSGTAGVSGVISSANSLVGSTTNDAVSGGSVTLLTNGNYVVVSPFWDNGANVNAGAVTWGRGTTGVKGVVSSGNSVIGSAGSAVGEYGVLPLTNGNYVISSPHWDNGAPSDVGAVTWASGFTGLNGAVSAANSLIGSSASDFLGNYPVTALTNGNYVVRSANWDNGAVTDAGAVTWRDGTIAAPAVVSAANSLVGSTANDQVGFDGVTALTNGNYVVLSTKWDNGAAANAGAATWGNGTTGVSGTVSAANSLVGSTASDQVGYVGVTALSNGNYVVGSPTWDNGAAVDAGAATWGNGTSGTSGAVSAANSLVGSTAFDNIGGGGGVTALSNGNYEVWSAFWDNGAVTDAGATTLGNGASGVTGAVSSANSLVGSSTNDMNPRGFVQLSSGNYLVDCPGWNNGAQADAGAVTWVSGVAGVSGAISAANSIVGTTSNDQISLRTVLANGNYVVGGPYWDNGATIDVGAATWCNGSTGRTGAVSAANSLVGSTANDLVGYSGVVVLSNGNYVVCSPAWDNGPTAGVGAATWCNGATGLTGAVSTANSLVGSKVSDGIGGSSTIALSNGNYVVASPNWDNGGLVDAGAATWGSGATGITGVVSSANSLVGSTASTGLGAPIRDDLSGTFIARFFNEIGGRVRVGKQESDSPLVLRVADVRNDQGGQVRLSFVRSGFDVLNRATPVTGYQVYRREAVALSSARRTASTGKAAPNQAAIAGWDYVLTVPATTDGSYQAVVPTLADSNTTGFHRAVLFVRAATATPGVYYDSPPDSGWSADNLPPVPPAPFVAAYSAGATHLHWGVNSESDLWYYAVYRGSSAGFTPGPANRIATCSDTGYADVGAPGSYYKLNAVDVNGNESGFVLVTPAGTTGVGAEAPVAFALEGVRPNPARGRGLHVAFALPTGEAAALELLDVSGRKVVSREVGALGVGRHNLNLAAGRSIAPGMYWIRLTQGPNRRTTRVAVIE